MAITKPMEIVISGVVRTAQYSGSCGDIYLYHRDSREGALARRGGHTNYGYSGYFLASIFDGHQWRKLQINKLMAYEQRSYDFASQRQDIIGNLARIISSWRGVRAIYSQESRSFSVPGREIA